MRSLEFCPSLERHICAAWERFRVTPPQDGVEFADNHYYLSPESSYDAGRWTTISYQKAILRAMTADEVQIVGWKKSARQGYTKLLAAAIAYGVNVKRINLATWQPTAATAKSWMASTIDTMIRDVPAVRKFAPWYGKKNSHNTNTEKKFTNGATLAVLGANGRNFRERSIHWALLDELDGHERDHDGEGDSVTLSRKRTENAINGKLIAGSTPTTAPSQIDELVTSCDVQLVRAFCCTSCGEYHPAEWENMTWTKGEYETTGITCPGCGVVWKYSELPELDDAGRWQTDAGDLWIDDDEDFLTFRDRAGAVVDTPRSIGFQSWSVLSRWYSWSSIAEDYDKLTPLGKAGFENTTLGRVFMGHGDDISETELENLRTPVKAATGKHVCVVAGVDVQKDRIEVTKAAFSRDGTCQILAHDIVNGFTDRPDTWQLLEKNLAEPLYHENGKRLHIQTTYVDSGFRAQYVYRFTGRLTRSRVYAIKGRNGFEGGLIQRGTATISQTGQKVPLVHIMADIGKVTIFDMLKAGKVQINDQLPAEYLRQLNSERLVSEIDKRTGREKLHWKKIRNRNEAFDCLNYCLAAITGLNPVWEKYEKAILGESENE